MPDEIRAAATVILWRDGPAGAEVLMGQRGAGAVFMPSKFVFPGGGVDPDDLARPVPGYLTADCARRLTMCAEAPAPDCLVAAALRELDEETGLSAAPARPGALRFVFRAITPPGRTRRFDARFFMADAALVQGDPMDLARASGELQHLRWLGLAEAKALDLPFVTEVVLAEVTALVAGQDQPGVPFFDNSGSTPQFRRLL